MKLKSDKYIKKLQRNVRELDLDIQAIIEEHDRYVLSGSTKEIQNWFDSLPIESLKELCDREKHRPRTKYSLHDMKHKFALRKLHDEKQEQLISERSKLNLAKIDFILSQIEKVNKDNNF
jgi:hypothetical protein